jgi:DeoR family fructose operon transcriptional repressor
MLTKQRQEIILKLLDERGSVTVTEAREILDASESTIRRDITALDQEGKLVKVFGGAVAVKQNVHALEYTVEQKTDLNRKEKEQIATYAASLIEAEDFIFLDAGTTTACMLEHMRGHGCIFVTNAVAHAQKLASYHEKVILVGGILKSSTEAVIGAQAVEQIRKFHFTKGFFGANGVSKSAGCTTPDPKEALVKEIAMKQCRQSYVLCDYSKFDQISSVTFAPFYGTTLITDRQIQGYEECGNVIVGKIQ